VDKILPKSFFPKWSFVKLIPGVLGQLVRIVGVSQVLDGVVQNQVEKGIEALQDPARLSAA
jgi:hypothetical protein